MGRLAILFMYLMIIGIISIIAYFVIKKAIKENRKYKNKYFKKFKNKEDVLPDLNIEPICWIDNIPFYNRSDIVKYANVTRQAVQNSFKNNGKTIGGKKIVWNKNNT